MKVYFQALLGLFILPFYAQTSQDSSKFADLQKRMELKALVVGRYAASFDKNIDFEGHHFSEDPEGEQEIVNNSFQMEYVRFATSFHINDRISTSILLNLANFNKETVSRKVLENAFVQYKANPYLNIRLGQFRPYFGLEDLHPFQLNNSYRWSNQYFLFGQNAWQSFQIGAAVYGELTKNNIPLKYYFTVYNGNNRNQTQDNDNNKNYSLRFEYVPSPIVQIGINGAITNRYHQNANAYGADLKINYPISPSWEIDAHIEYKKGTNFIAYNHAINTDTPLKNLQLNDFYMEGIYNLLRVKKFINNPYLKALEFSIRQEYLDTNSQVHGDILRSHIPMFSLVLAGDYNAKLSFVGVFYDYQTNIPDTSQYDSNRALIQFQVAF
ncbi:porin [Zunongwangia pacifica]|uniref:OprO/OprP family phosphate-selective porin n=1 Tax=Zunongwangia pacifica TaxID=2911062 RepID=A0A9X1ZVS6_9FLAO|nr:porin [Zunongwangia pacifica]MCL6220090.1 OprO/OprP family phosphate-selective porin [Zunongwangia pacifica]